MQTRDSEPIEALGLQISIRQASEEIGARAGLMQGYAVSPTPVSRVLTSVVSPVLSIVFSSSLFCL